MAKKTGVVTAVTQNGTWTSQQYGKTFYKFEVTFDNGDMGEYSSVSAEQNKFVVGQSAEYEISSREYNGNMYYTIKPTQSENSYGGGKYKKDPATERRIVRMSVLNRATDLVCHGQLASKDLFKTAEYMYKWVTQEDTAQPVEPKNNAPTPVGVPTNQSENPSQGLSPNDAFATEDDLPF